MNIGTLEHLFEKQKTKTMISAKQEDYMSMGKRLSGCLAVASHQRVHLGLEGDKVERRAGRSCLQRPKEGEKHNSAEQGHEMIEKYRTPRAQ